MSSYDGYQGSIEVQTDGVAGSAGWNELTLVGDADLNMNRNSSFRPKRGTQWKTSVFGQIEAEITGDVTWDDADTVIAAIESAFIAGTHIGVRFRDKDSGTGLTLDCVPSGWNHSTPEQGIQKVALTLTPFDAGTDPAWA